MRISPKQLFQNGATSGEPLVFNTPSWAPSNNVTLNNLTANTAVSIGSGPLSLGGGTLYYFAQAILPNNTTTQYAHIFHNAGGAFASCASSGKFIIRWAVWQFFPNALPQQSQSGVGEFQFALATNAPVSGNVASVTNVAAYAGIQAASSGTVTPTFSMVAGTPGPSGQGFLFNANINSSLAGPNIQILLNFEIHISGAGGYQVSIP